MISKIKCLVSIAKGLKESNYNDAVIHYKAAHKAIYPVTQSTGYAIDKEGKVQRVLTEKKVLNLEVLTEDNTGY